MTTAMRCGQRTRGGAAIAMLAALMAAPRASSAAAASAAATPSGAAAASATASAAGAGSASGVGSVPPPSAAPSARASDAEAASAERAKQLFASGAEAFAAQRNAEAIAYFRRAAELVPSAKLTYNIALAYEEMGDSGRALAAYRTYLSQEPEGERHDEVLGRIATLERRLAETGVQQLFVTSEPSGATVRIEGRAVGVTPWAGELSPGHHAVEVELVGHRSRRADVTLASDRSSELELALEPAPPEPPAAPPSRLARVSPLAWTFLGVGTGALAGGVAFELSRAHSSDEEKGASTPERAAEARGAADAKQMASLLLLGFGAGFTIGGSVLLALDLSGAPASATAAPRQLGASDGAAPSDARGGRRPELGIACAPGFCGFVTQGKF
jgi:tetratricopeptide (TPR) repeat protein